MFDRRRLALVGRRVLVRIQQASPLRHQAQRVVVKSVDLNRLSVAGSHHPSVHSRIHPGELGSFTARNQKAVSFVDDDSVVRTLPVPTEDASGGGIEFLRQETPISSGLEIRVHRLKHPERCIRGVVLGLLALIRESVRYQSLIQVLQKTLEHFSCFWEPSRDEQQPGKSDHCVPSPVREPRVTGDHRRAPIRAFDDELMRGAYEPARHRVGLKRTGSPGSLRDLQPFHRLGIDRLSVLQ